MFYYHLEVAPTSMLLLLFQDSTLSITSSFIYFKFTEAVQPFYIILARRHLIDIYRPLSLLEAVSLEH